MVEALLGTRLRGREFNRAPLVSVWIVGMETTYFFESYTHTQTPSPHLLQVAGSRNTVAIDADGRLLAWGWNARGTLGTGPDRAAARKPVRLPPPGDAPLVQAALGGWHCLALDEDGAAWAWGGNEYGQCGTDPETTGRDVASPSPCLPRLTFAQVSAGGMHSVGVTTDGDVWAWGERWGDFSVRVDRAPRPLPLPAPVAKVACGAFHTLALLDDGRVVAWGINDFGQLGSGDTTPTTTPAPVQGLPPAADVAAGGVALPGPHPRRRRLCVGAGRVWEARPRRPRRRVAPARDARLLPGRRPHRASLRGRHPHCRPGGRRLPVRVGAGVVWAAGQR